MLPSTKLGQASIKLNGGELVVEAKFRKLLELQAEMGVDALQAVSALASDPLGITRLLHHFQVPHVKKKLAEDGETLVADLDDKGQIQMTTYTQDDIFDWLFGNMANIQDPVVQNMVNAAICAIMGVDIEQERLRNEAASKKTKKKADATTA